MRRLAGILGVAFFVSSGSILHAQTNNLLTTAATATWGQKVTGLVGPSSEYWWRVVGFPDRSYCVEAANLETAIPTSNQWGDHQVFANLWVYRADGTTLVAAAQLPHEEPVNATLTRVCWVSSLGEDYKFKLATGLVPPATTQFVTLRFVDTTLFCPWFFIAGDYNAFSLLRNTSRTALSNVVITWRGLNGTAAGTTTVSVPANGGIIVSARDFVNPALFSNGTVEIVHPGSPGQLTGSTTTLSATTGLGFDAQFGARPAW